MRLEGRNLVNHILKIAVLSGALALCVMLFGLGNSSASGSPGAVAKASPAASASTCSTFCNSEGGPFYLFISTSETTCTQKSGDWFPDPGCCCKCSEPGRCL